MSPAAAFDRLAATYDELWTNTTIGQLQRQAVWRYAGPLFQPGQTILDIGCGTGEDAALLRDRGVRVIATDCSSEMVRVARARGVDSRVIPVEWIGQLQEAFHGAISNFGALNCVPDLTALREPLARLIVPGGYLVLCMIGRFCLWETLWYAARGSFRKAVRRWNGRSSSSLGLSVFYPRVAEIRRALSPSFEPISTVGIGVCVPPSYVTGLSSSLLERLGGLDRQIAEWPCVRAASDHRLLVFRRR